MHLTAGSPRTHIVRLQHSSFFDLEIPLDYIPQGHGFIAATQPKYASTSTGKLFLGVLAAIAEFENADR